MDVKTLKKSATKPPRPIPSTAALGSRPFKRLNLAITSIGSNISHTYIKKVPDHQVEAVAKIRPFSLLHKERFATP